jgi:hypothetical protein
MTEAASSSDAEQVKGRQRTLALLLAAAMFVLVVDTSTSWARCCPWSAWAGSCWGSWRGRRAVSPRSSGSGSPSRCSSRSPWAGAMIGLPIYLQMVLEYNAMQAALPPG